MSIQETVCLGGRLATIIYSGGSVLLLGHPAIILISDFPGRTRLQDPSIVGVGCMSDHMGHRPHGERRGLPPRQA